MEDLSYEFLTSRWFVHSHFMDLGNPFEVVVHHLLIIEMVGLGRPLRWGSYGECTSMYGYTLDKTYSKPWHKALD